MVRRQRAGKLSCYVRTMDDIVLLARTRWQLRRAIAELHACLRPLHLRHHPEKRFIGKLSRGFDFLGYQFIHLHWGRKLRPSPMRCQPTPPARACPPALRARGRTPSASALRDPLVVLARGRSTEISRAGQPSTAWETRGGPARTMRQLRSAGWHMRHMVRQRMRHQGAAGYVRR